MINNTSFYLSKVSDGVNLNYKINETAIIKDLVMQIDGILVKCIILFFISYILYTIILPRSIIGIEELKNIIPNQEFYFNQIIGIIKILISLFETFALGSVITLFYFSVKQGFIPNYIIIISYIFISLGALLLFLEFYNKQKNKKNEQ